MDEIVAAAALEEAMLLMAGGVDVGNVADVDQTIRESRLHPLTDVASLDVCLGKGVVQCSLVAVWIRHDVVDGIEEAVQHAWGFVVRHVSKLVFGDTSDETIAFQRLRDNTPTNIEEMRTAYGNVDDDVTDDDME
ncbi:Aste57867_366 [Aphanomyces stellatus]|uniref:Aste57867_366 protein n=1 Tax=Aphanomyces stellatus TaxID=120398 RepID=A0A485K2F5_9STRA|nr:hypothetical protein As57867_000365 [Aphanomyces stellatus]VFT77591.1 Aste57867_366 [Aphanomyces stellatus]